MGASRKPARSGPRAASTDLRTQRQREVKGQRDVERPLAPVPQAPPVTVREALPWRYPGLCSDPSRSPPKPRAPYLATFIPTPLGVAFVYRDPAVDASLPASMQRFLPAIRSGTKTGLEAPFPAIYLYRSVEALREHSCAGANASAYYDGAIHVAPEDLSRSLQHEYTHHVLVHNGIERPLWLQEGLAMRATGEEHHETQAAWLTWKDHPLSMERMVNLFPTTADSEDVATFYGQAYHMTNMLERLCLARTGCGPLELIEALRSGEATPETLFDWAVERRGSDLVAKTRVSLWEDYRTHGTFGKANYGALLERANMLARGR